MKAVIIESNPKVRQLFQALFEKLGGTTLITDDAAEAFDLVLQNRPTFIVLGVAMQGLPAPDLVEMLKENAQTRVIPIFAVGMPEDASILVECREQGAEELVTLPFKIPDLMQQIRKHQGATVTLARPALDPTQLNMVNLEEFLEAAGFGGYVMREFQRSMKFDRAIEKRNGGKQMFLRLAGAMHEADMNTLQHELDRHLNGVAQCLLDVTQVKNFRWYDPEPLATLIRWLQVANIEVVMICPGARQKMAVERNGLNVRMVDSELELAPQALEGEQA